MKYDDYCTKHDYYPNGRVCIEVSVDDYICPECEIERLTNEVSRLTKKIDGLEEQLKKSDVQRINDN